MDIRIKMLLLRPFFLVSPCTHAQGNVDSCSLLQYTNWLIVMFVLTLRPTLTCFCHFSPFPLWRVGTNCHLTMAESTSGKLPDLLRFLLLLLDEDLITF